MKQIKQYSLKEEIGRGGMSTVYRAFSEKTKQEVAIKLMRESLAGNEQAHARFVQEVQTVIALAHPAIVPIIEYGTVDDRLYIVMNYMPGGSVRELIKEGPLSLQNSINILQRVALALDAAHDQNIIHRDVKPHNILLDEAGQAYLSDFGIARSMDPEGPGKTITMIGTPEYVAPEQVAEGDLTSATDIYQLGITLFQMLTGQLPYSGSSYQIMSHHLNDPLPSAEALNPRLPFGCDTVLRRATVKTGKDRFPSALALADALAGLADAGTATHLISLPVATNFPAAIPLNTERKRPKSSFLKRAMVLTTGGALASSVALASWGVLPGFFAGPAPQAQPPAQNVQTAPADNNRPTAPQRPAAPNNNAAPNRPVTRDTPRPVANETTGADNSDTGMILETLVSHINVVTPLVEDVAPVEAAFSQEAVSSEEVAVVNEPVSEAVFISALENDGPVRDDGDAVEAVTEVVNETVIAEDTTSLQADTLTDPETPLANDGQDQGNGPQNDGSQNDGNSQDDNRSPEGNQNDGGQGGNRQGNDGGGRNNDDNSGRNGGRGNGGG